VERLAILHVGCAIDAAAVRAVLPIPRDTPPESAQLPDPSALERPLSDTLDEYERTLITRALSTAGGNVPEAARRLKTDRPNLYRRMRRLGIATADD